MYRNPVLVQGVCDAMDDLGERRATLKGIRSKLTCYDLNQIPSESTISKILHWSLNYGKRNYLPANARYNDPRFDCKRKFISQEIGTSLAGDDLVVCIDESSFSTHQYNKKKWSKVSRTSSRSRR